MLIVVIILSVPLGWIGWRLGQVRTEQATLTWIEKLGGTVLFRSDPVTIKRSWCEESTDKWFDERVFWSLKELNLGGTQVSVLPVWALDDILILLPLDWRDAV